jgi:hypothetical protein
MALSGKTSPHCVGRLKSSSVLAFWDGAHVAALMAFKHFKRTIQSDHYTMLDLFSELFAVIGTYECWTAKWPATSLILFDTSQTLASLRCSASSLLRQAHLDSGTSEGAHD